MSVIIGASLLYGQLALSPPVLEPAEEVTLSGLFFVQEIPQICSICIEDNHVVYIYAQQMFRKAAVVRVDLDHSNYRIVRPLEPPIEAIDCAPMSQAGDWLLWVDDGDSLGHLKLRDDKKTPQNKPLLFRPVRVWLDTTNKRLNYVVVRQSAVVHVCCAFDERHAKEEERELYDSDYTIRSVHCVGNGDLLVVEKAGIGDWRATPLDTRKPRSVKASFKMKYPISRVRACENGILVAGTEGGTVCSLNPTTGEQIAIDVGMKLTISSINVVGRRAIITSYDQKRENVALVDLNNNVVRVRLKSPSLLIDLQMLPDKKRFVACTAGGKVVIIPSSQLVGR